MSVCPMSYPSIFNDVLGPVMRGPSSSHTAGPYRIGRLARLALGEPPRRARFRFDRDGSFAATYRQQHSDLGFVAGLLGWEITDPRFPDALAWAGREGVEVSFEIADLNGADHPNVVDVSLEGGGGRALECRALSVGGGSIRVVRVFGQPVEIGGDREVALDVPGRGTFSFPPVMPVAGEGEPPLFRTAAGAAELAESHGLSLGEVSLRYEAARSGWDRERLVHQMAGILDVMRAAAETGLAVAQPMGGVGVAAAPALEAARKEGRLMLGGSGARAASIALAVLEVSASMGVVCAAPTAGSCGVVPGALLGVAAARGLADDALIRGLFAAGGVGLAVSWQATFAAEVCGCQAECGAASAMAAAALVEMAGGTADQACDAAAVALQNMLGSICDPVAGLVEVPCQGKNVMAAINAIAAADMVRAGYRNPVPLDETIVAMYEVGRMLPPELRCTARGGLSVTPSARALACRLSGEVPGDKS